MNLIVGRVLLHTVELAGPEDAGLAVMVGSGCGAVDHALVSSTRCNKALKVTTDPITASSFAL